MKTYQLRNLILVTGMEVHRNKAQSRIRGLCDSGSTVAFIVAALLVLVVCFLTVHPAYDLYAQKNTAGSELQVNLVVLVALRWAVVVFGSIAMLTTFNFWTQSVTAWASVESPESLSEQDLFRQLAAFRI
jgi:protein-S-isoprenylcysteine O-methyltransferase Ste14